MALSGEAAGDAYALSLPPMQARRISPRKALQSDEVFAAVKAKSQ
jgi:hypothetical protein